MWDTMHSSIFYAIAVIMALNPFCLAQLHNGLTDRARVDCYSCHSNFPYPACLLSTHRTCGYAEQCLLTYNADDGSKPIIGCSSRCNYRDLSPVLCPVGGQKNVGHKCHVCCDTSECVHRVISAMKNGVTGDGNGVTAAGTGVHQVSAAPQTSPGQGVYCPGHCPADNMQLCMGNGRVCPAGQFCMVTKDNGARINGHCKTESLHAKCTADKVNSPCPKDSLDLASSLINSILHPHCNLDCCSDNQCLMDNFGQYMTTQMPTTPTTVPPSTTPTPTTTIVPMTTTMAAAPMSTPSLYARFKTDCKDQLEAGICSALKVSQDVCSNALSIELCPDTCGVCQVITNAKCHDTVLNGGCKDLQVTKDICNDPLAKYTCPDTCGVCDVQIEQMIQNIINGNTAITSTASTAPPSQSPVTTSGNQMSQFDCNGLYGIPCDAMAVTCNGTVIQKTCPKQCAECL